MVLAFLESDVVSSCMAGLGFQHRSGIARAAGSSAIGLM